MKFFQLFFQSLLNAALTVYEPFLSDRLLRDLRRFAQSEREFESEINQTISALSSSTELITTLEERLKKRINQIESLKEEYSNLEVLKTLTEEQAKAVSARISNAIGINQKRERNFVIGSGIFIGFLIGLIFFVLGDIFRPGWTVTLFE